MPRRERNDSRRGASRPQRPSILVVCGAEKTEVAYMKGLRDHVGSVSIDLVVKERPTAPDQVVAFARDYAGGKDFDERWCVVDVDMYEREGRRISAAVQVAASCGAELAISNPCFEFWLLLHHADRRPPAIMCREIEAALREHLPGYDKTVLRFSDFADGLENAVRRARKIDDGGGGHEVNPSTGMWRLVERIVQ